LQGAEPDQSQSQDQRDPAKRQILPMTDKKFYKSTYTVEILHEEPMPDDFTLSDALQEADIGDYVQHVRKTLRNEEVDARTMVDLLYDAGASPGFFMIDENGDSYDGS
jgi:hypothetical protein